jgi:hypothetical protein
MLANRIIGERIPQERKYYELTTQLGDMNLGR